MDHLNVPVEYGSHVEIDGQSCLGSHYIGEIFGAVGMDDPHFVEATLRKCALSAGATILQSNMHHFPSGGVTGIVILSESHISIHSWPEHDYAAIDIFMCGRAKISEAVRVIETDFMPKRLIGKTLLRGHDDQVTDAAPSLSKNPPAMVLDGI